MFVTVDKNSKSGLVITESPKKAADPSKQIGFVKVVSQNKTFNPVTGFRERNTRAALISDTMEAWKADAPVLGEVWSGKIIRKEQYTPFHPNQKCKSYPLDYTKVPELAGTPVLHNGQKVYVRDTYTDNLSLFDELLPAENPTVAEEANVVAVADEQVLD